VHLRTTAIGVLNDQGARATQADVPVSFAPIASRKVWLDRATDWHTASCYSLVDGKSDDGNVFAAKGPSLIDLHTNTVLVPPEWECSIANSGDLVLARQGNG
jgi:hypothetical protein